jgi:hypothetical protein
LGIKILAAQDHWEFFCAPEDAEAGLRGWGWRLRRGDRPADESVRFHTFIECYRHALKHGFSGDIDFAESLAPAVSGQDDTPRPTLI